MYIHTVHVNEFNKQQLNAIDTFYVTEFYTINSSLPNRPSAFLQYIQRVKEQGPGTPTSQQAVV